MKLRDVWEGNRMVPGNAVVTDGRFVVWRKHAKPSFYRRLERMQSKARNVSRGRLARTIERCTRGRKYSVEVPGVMHEPGSNGVYKPHRTLRSGPTYAWVDDRLFQAVVAAAPFDKVRWNRRTRGPLLFYLGKDLTALLMGITPPDGAS